MMLLFVLAAVLAAGSCAPKACSSPNELSFRSRRWRVGDSDLQEIYGQYDKRFKRIVYIVEYADKSVHQFLFLHESFKGYDYNMKNKTCDEFPIGAFKVLGVPAGATYLGEFTLGGPGEGFDVEVWNNVEKGVDWTGEFSKINCYPVRMYEKEAKQKTLNTVVFDTVLGIKNPNDFNLPEACKKATKLNVMSDEASKQTSFLSKLLQN